MQRDKYAASSSSSDLQLGWALHKPRNQGVRFAAEVKQYLTTKFDLGERTGNQQGRSRKSVCRHENSKKTRWLADVRQERLANEESSTGLFLETGGHTEKAGERRGTDRGRVPRGGRTRKA